MLFRLFGGCIALILAVASVWAEKSIDYPLHDAINRNDLERLVGLLQSGHNPNELDQHGRTALIHVIARQRDDDYLYVSELLRFGANSNTPDRTGATPLHHAAMNGSSGLAKLLADSGADVKADMSTGATVLAFAYQNGHLDIAIMLEQYGAIIDPDVKRKLIVIGLVDRAIRKTEEMDLDMSARDKAEFMEYELRKLREIHELHFDLSDEYIRELVLEEFQSEIKQ